MVTQIAFLNSNQAVETPAVGDSGPDPPHDIPYSDTPYSSFPYYTIRILLFMGFLGPIWTPLIESWLDVLLPECRFEGPHIPNMSVASCKDPEAM